MKKIGFLGGTFDPPHLGHLLLAKAAIKKLELDTLIFSVANLSPAKQKSPSSANEAQRLEMLSLMIHGQKSMSVIDYEIKKGGVSYTIDLVHELRRLYPNDKLFMVVSNDVYNTLLDFKEIKAILKECTIAVGARSPTKLTSSIEHVFIANTFLETSSTQIRDFLKKKKDVKKFLDRKVFDFIVENQLYL